MTTTISYRIVSLAFAFGCLVGMTIMGVLVKLSTRNEERGEESHRLSSEKEIVTAPLSDKQEQQIRPFEMPIKGDRYHIFQPHYDLPSMSDAVLVGPAEDVTALLQERVAWLNSMVQRPDNPAPIPPRHHAILAYLHAMKQFVSGSVFGPTEFSIRPTVAEKKKFTALPFNATKRSLGMDWAYLGDTMTGWARLDNVAMLILDATVIQNIPGDYIETGVWRGGSSIFARATLRAHSQKERKSFVCDSFAGLPPGDRSLDPRDEGWEDVAYLQVAPEIVAQGFRKYSLMDENVIFVKGFFNDTMPHLSTHIDNLAVMRLDGDMYESTVDVLYHLYDKLSIGGYVIIDDWSGFPAQTACRDFFAVHEMHEPEIVAIDTIAAYWKKTEQVEIQYWRYQQGKFKPTQG